MNRRKPEELDEAGKLSGKPVLVLRCKKSGIYGKVDNEMIYLKNSLDRRITSANKKIKK